jgi:hypothetical protein
MYVPHIYFPHPAHSSFLSQQYVTLTFRYVDAICGRIPLTPSHLALEDKADEVWRDSEGAPGMASSPEEAESSGHINRQAEKTENPLFNIFDNVISTEVLRLVDPGDSLTLTSPTDLR